MSVESVTFFAPSSSTTVRVGDATTRTLPGSDSWDSERLQNAERDVQHYFENSLSEGGRVFYGQTPRDRRGSWEHRHRCPTSPSSPSSSSLTISTPCSGPRGRNCAEGQPYTDIGGLPLHDKKLFPDSQIKASLPCQSGECLTVL